MAPFLPPNIILSGFKERIESLLIQGDKLYVGTATGNLYIYVVHNGESSEGERQAELIDTKKALSRRPIEQLAYVQDINSLAVLADGSVTLYPISTFTPPTPLPKTKSALSLACHTVVEHEHADDPQPPQATSDMSITKSPKSRGVPVVVTHLAIGCRRKIVVYSWRDGEPLEPKEANLPHSPRTIAFLNDGYTLCFGYTPTDYVLFSLKSMSAIDIAVSLTTSTSNASLSHMSRGALSGLSGYMTLGLGAKAKPNAVTVTENEFLIAKEREYTGLFIGEDGKQSRSTSIDWPAPPEDLALVRPYLFSVLPPGSVPSSRILPNDPSAPSFVATTVLEIRSSISLQPVQNLPVPLIPLPESASPTSVNQTIRLLTSSGGYRSPLYLVTTPADRTTANAEGSSIVEFRMKSWEEQIDELVEAESYAEALSLLETLEPAILPDKEQRRNLLRALKAVSLFRGGNYSEAINTFIDLNTNPAKVVALYPESIAGRLLVPQDEWIPLFGGPRKPEKTETPPSEAQVPQEDAETPEADTAPQRPASPHGSILRTGLEHFIASARRDDDTASIRSARRGPQKDNFRISIEELMRYLSDRRPRISGALEAFRINNAQAHQMPPLSSASVQDLFSLPDAPLTSLTPEQLVRFGQIVDTALFKSYLAVRPGLLAPLCRSGNWCEVSEVEKELKAREKFSELIYLYNGKKMHGKALDLLRHLSEQETDMRDKLIPSVNYLQRLGPEHIEQVFDSSRWVFEQDPNIALEIFTSEEAELPRQHVTDFLEMLDPGICAKFIEFLIAERDEESPSFHDRLAELYLRMASDAKRRGDNEQRRDTYGKLLHFIDTTDYYRPDRLYGLLPSEDFHEAKAILLGRLGRHDNALEIYVYRLQDFQKAEEYCKRMYQPSGPTASIYLTLLRIYLRPIAQPPSPTVDLLQPALEIISRHSRRLDIIETLKLLPPLVTAQDVRAFFIEALRAPVFDRKVINAISKARDEQVARHLMVLQAKKVKVTDSRICPHCHKRIGNSVIVVHAPRGEVTHYQCREAFSKKLKDLRH